MLDFLKDDAEGIFREGLLGNEATSYIRWGLNLDAHEDSLVFLLDRRHLLDVATLLHVLQSLIDDGGIKGEASQLVLKVTRSDALVMGFHDLLINELMFLAHLNEARVRGLIKVLVHYLPLVILRGHHFPLRPQVMEGCQPVCVRYLILFQWFGQSGLISQMWGLKGTYDEFFRLSESSLGSQGRWLWGRIDLLHFKFIKCLIKLLYYN